MTTEYSPKRSPRARQLALPWPVGEGTPEGARERLLRCVEERLPRVWADRLRRTLMGGWNAQAAEAVQAAEGVLGGLTCARVFEALANFDGGGRGAQAREDIILVALWYSMEPEAFSRGRWRKYRMRLLTRAATRLQTATGEEKEAWWQVFASLLEGVLRQLYRRYGEVSGQKVPWDDFRQELLLAAWQQVQRFDPGRGTQFMTLVYPHLEVAARRRARAVVIDAKPGQVERAVVEGSTAFSRAVLTPRVSLDAEADDADADSPLRAERWGREDPGYARTEAALALKALEAQIREAVEAGRCKPPRGFFRRFREAMEGRGQLRQRDLAFARQFVRG